MRFWLDTEFNGFGGELISMALVGEDGAEWYESLGCSHPHPWVAAHVMPILNREAVTLAQLQASLRKFLESYSSAEIIADWPEDIAHFCRTLIIAPGQRMRTPALSFVIDTDRVGISTVPHNALEDARAMRRANQKL